MQSFKIRENEAGQRLDKYLKKRLVKAPASFLYKMLRKKNIVLNGKKADGSEKLGIGDEVKLFLSEDTFLKFSLAAPEPGKEPDFPRAKLAILYETKDIIILNKPPGMLSQKAKPEDASANEYLISYLLDSQSISQDELQTFRPAVCNRLDRNTSGILIAGKSLWGLQEMSRQLKERTIEKYYQCLVYGSVTEQKTIEGWLLKDRASNKVTVYQQELPESSCIKTAYRPLEQVLNYTLLEVHLMTGRSHQIRAHLAAIGHPIAGDSKYGTKEVNKVLREGCGVNRQLLHASRIVLEDGTTLLAPLAKDFDAALTYLRKKETR